MTWCWHENSLFMGLNTRGDAVYVCKDCNKSHSKEMQQVFRMVQTIDRQRYFRDPEYRHEIIKRLDNMVMGGVKPVAGAAGQ